MGSFLPTRYIVKGTGWLLDSKARGNDEDEITPDLFIRSMQSGALQNMGSSNFSRVRARPGDRPMSAPSQRLSKEPSKRMDATVQNHIGECNTLELRRERFCAATGITNIWAKRENDRRTVTRRPVPLRPRCKRKA
eukprot:CAMPEP_0169274704 /NCGR_PEP_ID=MMETSP1016-20121227/51878_1 /TAXON_ID=342587 /ORGANISM="Karlodinium micrum, Strain CCMP2283" /LENGTH=135 /DNA_ID=CAMNT_0009361305 /DNA_START=123 /DNA_END=527 /DNA_ORIENTATION=-